MITFKELGLQEEILTAIEKMGFVNPSPIQEKAIPQILSSDQDVIALAQTGTGKTAAFGLPVLNQLDSNSKSVQAIILCPTRELCLQIAKELESFSADMRGVRVQAVYGGADIVKQIRGLKDNPQIVVGTPGRTMDLIKRGALKINDITWTVLDEADEMLNMGFRDEIDSILETTPEEKQTLLFSATMPSEVRRIASEYMHNPVEIAVSKVNTASKNIEHHVYLVRSSDRYLALKRLADYYPNIYGIVFCRTRREAKDVADKLMQDGYNADALHGDLSQSQRDHVMEKFRNQNIQILVATDVAARGIDVNELTHVINFNLPDDPEVYVHRSGRTGRAGNKGISIIISGGREARKIRDLEKLIASKIEPKNVPTGAEICEKRLISLIDKIENIEVDEELIEPYMETVNEKLANLDRDDLLKRFMTVEFNSFLEYYKNTKDISSEGDRGDRGDRSSNRRGGRDFSRFFINIGQKHNLRVPNLIGLINEQTRNRNIEIGKIEILRNFSFFEVDTQFESLVLESFKDAQRDGVDLDVQISKPEPRRGDGERRGGDRRRNDRGGDSRGRGFNSRRDNDRERSGGYRGGDRDRGGDRGGFRGGDRDRDSRDSRGGDRGGYRGGDRNRTGNSRRGRD
ncbi:MULTISPECIES: DEAD/DEAH box helicase [Empedobacter]|uniref:DEAD-box ATP-dependent RNA helicase RhpA n=3 Tax=Weeksellaceae TaxID=2762318 RepID=A0A7H9DXH0_9FLAO|nr:MULTISPECIES: DEAD/DEAH box helicase [Empedobacter]MDM1298095.1 DEAD/DEAH box helicase [Empedobacter falsenii]MDM1317830.1 DEAD/DEAH box helicase [Empedobacter falsenii]MDM1546912.1 DEAD/DEAH box helicase [Empedobacter falsenii]MDM1550796.1 DEAD/DEAH box helicase [Empedobacter falsenii]QLL59810.1 DEAD/DEAH box helicase [Empedobacter falsenii]